jgi:hypothetical protein
VHTNLVREGTISLENAFAAQVSPQPYTLNPKPKLSHYLVREGTISLENAFAAQVWFRV